MINSLFEYSDYRKYVEDSLNSHEKSHGLRSKLAQFIGCQPAFISRVLSGIAQFSLEQVVKINRFFGHTNLEGEFFLILAHLDRAGSEELKKFYLAQLEQIKAKRNLVKERISLTTEISKEDQMTYFSSWIYNALHIGVGVPELQTKQRLAKHFHLTMEEISPYLNFLVEKGFIIKDGEKLLKGKSKIHLSSESPMIGKFHTNWRIQAIDSYDKVRPSDLHFSGIYTISKKDLSALKENFLQFIQKNDAFIRPSLDETLCCICLDLFEFNKTE